MNQLRKWSNMKRVALLVKRLVRKIIATFRLNQRIICEESKHYGPWDDYHDYPDSEEQSPLHFVPLTCRFCKKRFYI